MAAFEALTLTSCGPTSTEVTEQEWDAGVKVGLKNEYQITSTATIAISFTGFGEHPIVTNAQSKTIISLKDGEMDVVMQATSDDKTTLNQEYYYRKASSGYTMYFFDNLDASKNFTQNVMTIDLNGEDPLGLSGRYKAFTYDGKAYTAPGSLDDLGDALGSLGLEGVVDVSNVKSTEKVYFNSDKLLPRHGASANGSMPLKLGEMLFTLTIDDLSSITDISYSGVELSDIQAL